MFPVILESLVSTCFNANGVSLDLKQPTENMHAFSTQSCVRVLRGCMNLLNLRISMGSNGYSTLSKVIFLLVQIVMILWRQLGIHSLKRRDLPCCMYS